MNNPKRGRGAPTRYKPEFCDAVIEYGREGLGVTEIAAKLDISRKCLLEWEGRHDDFGIAMARARELSQAWWEEQGRKGMWAGKQFNAQAYMHQMRNRFPDDWRDVAKIDIGLGSLAERLDRARDRLDGRIIDGVAVAAIADHVGELARSEMEQAEMEQDRE